MSKVFGDEGLIMDVPAFDRLARRLGRRTVLGWLGMTALAPTAVAAVPVAEKKKPRSKKACRKYNGVCTAKKRCCKGTVCRSGRCLCPVNTGRCGTSCVVAPGNRCGAGNICDPAAPDVCAGDSSCTGRNSANQPVCCGIANVHRCGVQGLGDAACCSKFCGPPNSSGTRVCA